ncbi:MULTISPECIES: hypothetical protein [unclassified Streptomyces]|uniref:hypothetical protein n=1 Tax=unclassified Streptomyces TaxID=2593676 RepID=UPI00081E4507|nr:MULTISPECIES: hypothetical protein [unclassified Streptomyces]MYZ37916.1 hypothetical protein [Streptomyces sp. SID4917]SCF95151.1 hypothetical protein GA0115259_105474 [Streptomyces sp. MnatMP-M17]
MAADACLYRAVITKTYADGTSFTEYEGPYAKPGPVRGHVTFWGRHFAATKPGASVDGHIEECRPQWRRVPGEGLEPEPPAS